MRTQTSGPHEGGVGSLRTPADKRGGGLKLANLADVFYGWPLTETSKNVFGCSFLSIIPYMEVLLLKGSFL